MSLDRSPIPPAWLAAIAAFETHQSVNSAAESTISKRSRDLRMFARASGVSPWEATEEDVTAWLAQPRAPETRSSYRSSLKAFYAWALGVGHVEANPVPGYWPGRDRDDAWGKAMAAWGESQRAAGTPATTMRTRRQLITQLRFETGSESPWDLTTADLVSWIASHDKWVPATKRSARTALRHFYGWAFLVEIIPADPTARIPTVRQRAPRPHPTPDDVLEATMAAAGPREQLIMVLAARLGLRRAEISRVHSRDVVTTFSGPALRVLGKGEKERTIPLPADVAELLRALPTGYAFPGQDEGHLAPDTVGAIINRLLPRGWTLHSLRHRFATRVFHASGGNLLVTQQLLGHSSVATTQIYVAVASDSLRAAVLAAG